MQRPIHSLVRWVKPLWTSRNTTVLDYGWRADGSKIKEQENVFKNNKWTVSYALKMGKSMCDVSTKKV